VALDVYRKRSAEFNVTTYRSRGGGKIKRGGNAFVIQKLRATRLHYGSAA